MRAAGSVVDGGVREASLRRRRLISDGIGVHLGENVWALETHLSVRGFLLLVGGGR